MSHDKIGHLLRVREIRQTDENLVGKLPVQADILAEEVFGKADITLDLQAVSIIRFQGHDICVEASLLIVEPRDLGTIDPLHKDLNQTIRELQNLKDVPYHAHIIEIVGLGFFFTWVSLGDEHDLLRLHHGLFDSLQRLLTPDK